MIIPNRFDEEEDERKSADDTGIHSNSRDSNGVLMRSANSLFRMVSPFLLPAGYPDSVDATYASFYKWEFVKSVVSSASYMISTQAMLSCIGLCSAPTAGAINWVLKDGLGCVGVILVARGLGKRFDKETKRLRWAADGLHVLGVGVELCTMLAPALFLPMASVANTAKGMAGITNGATRAAINKSLALSDNLGDLTAKAHAQGLLGYLSGMGVGVTLFSCIEGTFFPMLLSYLAFTSVHMFASYRALRSVSLPTLNKQRLCILLDHYFKKGILLEKDAVRSQEHIIIPPRYPGREITLGCSLDESGLTSNLNDFQAALDMFGSEDYIVSITEEPKRISVILRNESSQQSLLKAFFNAYYLNDVLKDHSTILDEEKKWDVISRSHKYTLDHFPQFLDHMAEKGWDNHVLLMTKQTRASWGNE